MPGQFATSVQKKDVEGGGLFLSKVKLHLFWEGFQKALTQMRLYQAGQSGCQMASEFPDTFAKNRVVTLKYPSWSVAASAGR